MFQDENIQIGLDRLNTSLKLIEFNLVSIGKTLKKSLTPFNEEGTGFLDTVAAINKETSNLTRSVLGQAYNVTKDLQATLSDATYETVEFGISMSNNLELIKQINLLMERNTYLTKEQMVTTQILAKNAGLTATEMATIFEGFDTLGRGTDYAIGQISKMEQQARAYGVNVGQFMQKITENMKVLSFYNFKDGEEGFSRMLMKAQALRMDVSQTFSLAERLLDPEVAIETAAGFQMLGGAIGDLGDPFKLLHLAQTDIEGLQDSLIEMSASAVSFNKDSGEFDIPVSQMYRIREAAKLAGRGYQEFAGEALRAAAKTKKLEMLEGFQTMDEKDKNLIANLGEIGEGGELKVKIPGVDDLLTVQQLQDQHWEELRDLQKLEGKTDREIAYSQLGYLEDMATDLNKMVYEPVKQAFDNPDIIKLFNTGLKENVADHLKNVSDDYNAAIETVMTNVVDKTQELLFNDVVAAELKDLNKTAINVWNRLGNIINELAISNRDSRARSTPTDNTNDTTQDGLAEGGIVIQPETRLIGEAGPEAIIPLDGFYGEFIRPMAMFDNNIRQFQETNIRGIENILSALNNIDISGMESEGYGDINVEPIINIETPISENITTTREESIQYTSVTDGFITLFDNLKDLVKSEETKISESFVTTHEKLVENIQPIENKIDNTRNLSHIYDTDNTTITQLNELVTKQDKLVDFIKPQQDLINQVINNNQSQSETLMSLENITNLDTTKQEVGNINTDEINAGLISFIDKLKDSNIVIEDIPKSIDREVIDRESTFIREREMIEMEALQSPQITQEYNIPQISEIRPQPQEYGESGHLIDTLMKQISVLRGIEENTAQQNNANSAAPTSVTLNVDGKINLDLNNTPTKNEVDMDAIGRELSANLDFTSKISQIISKSVNTYGGLA